MTFLFFSCKGKNCSGFCRRFSNYLRYNLKYSVRSLCPAIEIYCLFHDEKHALNTSLRSKWRPCTSTAQLNVCAEPSLHWEAYLLHHLCFWRFLWQFLFFMMLCYTPMCKVSWISTLNFENLHDIYNDVLWIQNAFYTARHVNAGTWMWNWRLVHTWGIGTTERTLSKSWHVAYYNSARHFSANATILR